MHLYLNPYCQLIIICRRTNRWQRQVILRDDCVLRMYEYIRTNVSLARLCGNGLIGPTSNFSLVDVLTEDDPVTFWTKLEKGQQRV